MRILTSVNNGKISPFSLFAMLYISRLVVSLTHVQSIMAGKLSTQMLMSVGVALVLSLLFAVPALLCVQRELLTVGAQNAGHSLCL